MAVVFTKRIWQPCICQPNKLEREIKKKLGGQTEGQEKIWGTHGPPRPPLRIATALWEVRSRNNIEIDFNNEVTVTSRAKFSSIILHDR